MRRIAALFMLVFAVVLFSVSAQAQAAKSATKTVAKVAVTPNTQLLKLAAAGMGDDVLLATVVEAKAKKQRYDTSADALIALKDAGVSQKVIAAVMGVDIPATTTPAVVPASREEPSKVPSPKNAVGEVVLPDGTEVKLRLVEKISSSKVQVDDIIRFEAVEAVLVDGKTVIAEGAEGAGKVTEAKKGKSFGRSGNLAFTIDYVKAVDGQHVRLRTSKEVEGDERYAGAAVASLIFLPAGLFIKGKDVVADAGKEYTIYIAGNRRINLAKASAK
jgi:hypothetical protein